jgi:hypothetical protein
MGDRDEIFDRGPVKSNLISHELSQDLPRGESRIQLLPDKDDGRIGVAMSVSSTRRAEELEYSGQQHDANAVQPRNHLFPALKFGNRKHRNTVVEPGSELIYFIISLTTRDCRRLEEQRRANSKMKNGNEWPKKMRRTRSVIQGVG